MIALQSTSEVIDVAKGISDYGAVIMLAALMIVYIIWQIVDNFRRQKRYEEQNTGMAAMAEFARRAADFFEEKAARKVNVDQARAIVSAEFHRVVGAVVVEIVEIKEANNLDQANIVQGKIEMFLDGMYASTESFLRKFEFEGHSLHSFLESEWKSQTKRRMTDDCTTHEYNIGRLKGSYDNEFTSHKNVVYQKLDEIQYPKN